jgi:hypothetical protein
MSTASVARRARQAVALRLQDIRTLAGYYTDMGLYVHTGRVSFTAEALSVGPAVTVYTPTEEFVDLSGNQHRIALSITVEAFAAYTDDPDTVADDLLADLKTALLREAQPALTDAAGPIGQRLAYVSADIDLPDPGEQMVMVTVLLRCHYFERYGAPALTH